MTENGTEELIELAAKGDHDAAGRLFETHRARLERMVQLRMDDRLKRRMDVDDVIQDVCLEASRRLPDYHRAPTMPFFLWLRFLATQKLLEHHRRHVSAQRRDVRITQIYEGTNAVQALDLVGRKLPAHAGRYLRSFFHPLMAFIEANRENPQLAPMVAALEKATVRLQQATGLVARKGLADPNEAAGASVAYLRLFGLVALGWIWARSAQVAAGSIGSANGDAGFYQAKLDTARYYFEHLLPQSSSLFASIAVGARTVMNASEAAFTRH